MDKVKPKLTEHLAIMRLVRLWPDHYCFPNTYMCGGEMDLAVVTKPARLLWEIEVKLSLDDWRADAKKRKWSRPDQRAKLSRFYYAVPGELLDKVPDHVTPDMGLIGLTPYLEIRRKAQLLKPSTPLTDRDMCNLLDTTYYRYWTMRWSQHRGEMKTQ